MALVNNGALIMNQRTLLTLVLIGTVGILAYFGYKTIGKASVSIHVNPTIATITIDKQTYSTSEAKAVTLPFGSHDLTITAPGYKPINTTLELGWRETLQKNYTLNVANLRSILAVTNPDIGLDGTSIEQEKFFENNTWAAGYVFPDDPERDVAVVVVRRVNESWKPVLYSNAVPEDAATTLPQSVYQYIAEFGAGE